MAKIGRNEPCPCGSGKKYKLCCLKKRQAEMSDNRQLEEAANELFGRIMQLIQGSQTVDFTSALNLYWDGKFSPDDLQEMDRGDTLRFIDWYAFDYRTSTARARTIDLLGEQDLAEAQGALWERWREIPISLYRVEDRAATDHATLRDILREDEPLIKDLMVGQEVGVGDVLAARVLPTGTSHVLLAPPILLPADSEEEIVSMARDRYSNYRQVHPEASWDEFLRENSYTFNHYALRLAGWQAIPKIHLPDERQPKVRVDSSGLITLVEDDEEEPKPRERASSSGLILPARYEERRQR